MDTDSFRVYMNAIGKYPLLTPKQEIQLARQVQRYIQLRDSSEILTKEEKRDIRVGLRARDRLVSCNLRLVIYVAKKYSMRTKSGTMDIMDLVQEGSIGLQRAAEMFDGTKGYKFSTYSYWWIRQAITRAIDGKERLIRLPSHALAKIYKLIKVQREFLQANGRMPTLSEMCQMNDIDSDELRLLMERNAHHGSLDVLAADDGSPILDLLADKSNEGADHTEIELVERTERLLAALDTLDASSREVLVKTFGLDGKQPVSYSTIGKAIGVSRDAIRQRADKAKNRVKLEMLRMDVLGENYTPINGITTLT